MNTTKEEYFCSTDDDCMDGTCNNETATCDCESPDRYGTLCEHTFDCTVIGCANDGICNEETGVCDCVEPFLGPDCVKEPNCAKLPNGTEDAYCSQWYGGGSVCDMERETCKCGWDFFFPGKRCSTNCKIHGDCKNGGTCNVHGNW